MQKAVYTGSFDPITLGHLDIIQRISKVYDEVIILVAHSSQKSSLFSVGDREAMIRQTIGSLKNVRVASHEGLTVDFVKSIGAQVIVRGLRAVVDFEYEMAMAAMNKKLAPEIETVLVFASPDYYYVSSRAIKEIARHGGSLQGLVSEDVAVKLREALKK